jgi:hypothetical protein
MEYKTTELTITVQPNNIIEIKIRDDLKEGFTMEGAIENIALIEKIVNNEPRCVIVWMPDIYMKKDIIKHYNEFEQKFVITALITKSFASKIVGNLFLTLRARFISKNTIKTNPIKLFTAKEEATTWLLETMKKQQSVEV